MKKRKLTKGEQRNREEYVAFLCSQFTGLKFYQTPDQEEYDFHLYNDSKIKVMAEVKIRTSIYPDWFIAQKKIDWLLDTCERFKAVPWFLVYCLFNRTLYKLNLRNLEYYEPRDGEMLNTELENPELEKGKFVLLKHWQVIDPSAPSEDLPRGRLDWK